MHFVLDAKCYCKDHKTEISAVKHAANPIFSHNTESFAMSLKPLLYFLRFNVSFPKTQQTFERYFSNVHKRDHLLSKDLIIHPKLTCYGIQINSFL